MTDSSSSVGQSLREWRRVCKLSQLELALAAKVSARHISFIETGKTQPTREMLLKLAQAMDLQLEQLNSLLIAAGYAIEKPALSWQADEVTSIRRLVMRLIEKFEPYPALVINAEFDILAMNQSFRLIESLIPEALTRYSNLLELVMAEDGLRPLIANWPEVQRFATARLRETAYSANNSRLQALLAKMMAQQAANERVTPREKTAKSSTLYLPINMQIGPHIARFYTLILMPGTPVDITQEFRIVVMALADDETELLLQTMADTLPKDT